MHWAPTVYVLCVLSSAICAYLLIRSYGRTRTKLLLWSAVCFLLLAINNLLVFADIVLFPTAIDLAMVRLACSLAAVLTLLYGFIWELD